MPGSEVLLGIFCNQKIIQQTNTIQQLNQPIKFPKKFMYLEMHKDTDGETSVLVDSEF